MIDEWVISALISKASGTLSVEVKTMLRWRDLISRICLALAIISAMGLFLWRRQQRPTRHLTFTDRDVATEMRVRARQAVETAAKEYHTVLDFSPNSIEKIEEILSKIHEHHSQSPLSDSKLTQEPMKWGGYVGEVIKTVRPGRWALKSEGNGEGSLPMVYEDKSESFPVLWCYNRIKNGEEANVWHKFMMLVVDRDKPDAYELRAGGLGADPRGK
jgi:hypothetical protein